MYTNQTNNIMKVVNIKGLTIQFDTSDEGADQHTAHDMIDDINQLLQRNYSFAQPQIMFESFDGDNVEITSDENE
jgi:hypothetical protein